MLRVRHSKKMSLINSSILVALSLSLLACNVQTASQNAPPQSSESKIQNPETPSPAITPTPEQEVAFGKGLKITPQTVELNSESRRYRIDVTFPQIEGSKSRGILKLNRRIKDLVTKKYQWPLGPPTKEDLRQYEKWQGLSNSVDIKYEVILATDKLLSIYFDEYDYGIGAAHSVHQSFTVNFDLSTETPIQLAGLFKPDAKYLQFISDYCLTELSKDQRYGVSYAEGLAPKPKNYESWNMTEEGLRFNFDACEIAACAAGKLEVRISFDALKEKLRPNSPVSDIAAGGT